jgi:hypothetical protein
MAITITEKLWLGFGPRAFVADGTANGLITLADARGVKVKQKIAIKSAAEPEPLLVEVKRFFTANSFYVGLPGENINRRLDLSAYLVSDSATAEAAAQARPNIPQFEHERAVYEEEPTLAKRVVGVDELGRFWGPSNPLPVAPVSEEMAESLALLVVVLPVASANTEFSYAVPNSARKIRLQMRDGKGPLRIYDSSGGSAFYTISKGAYYLVDNIRPSDLTVFFQSAQPGFLELAIWYAT